MHFYTYLTLPYTLPLALTYVVWYIAGLSHNNMNMLITMPLDGLAKLNDPFLVGKFINMIAYLRMNLRTSILLVGKIIKNAANSLANYSFLGLKKIENFKSHSTKCQYFHLKVTKNIKTLHDNLLNVSVLEFVCFFFALSFCSRLSLSSHRWIHVVINSGRLTGLDQ